MKLTPKTGFILVITTICLVFIIILKSIPIWRIQEELRVLSKAADVIFLPLTFKSSNLTHFDITLDPMDQYHLEELASQSINQPPPDWVSATLNVNGQSYPAKVKFRGQNQLHWRDQKKSWRIKLKNNQTWQYMNEFNLIIPYDRGYISEAYSYWLGEKLNLHTPPHQFVTMSISGTDTGVYLLTQQWSPRLLSNIGLDSNTDLYSDTNHTYSDPTYGIYSNINNFEKKVSQSGSETDITNLKTLTDLMTAPDDQFQAQINDILDLDYATRWIAHSNLMFSTGQQFGHNIFLYYHPKQQQFQPILWNTGINYIIPIDQYPIDIYFNPLIGRLLERDDIAHKRNLTLWQYLSDSINISNDLESIGKWQQQIMPSFYSDTIKHYSNFDVWFQTRLFKQKIQQGYQRLTQKLHQAKAQLNINQISPTQFQIDITSSGFSSIKLQQINFDTTFDSITLTDQANQIITQSSPSDHLILENILIHTHRQRPQQYWQDMVYQPQTQTFILKLSSPSETQPQIILTNAVTGETIQPDTPTSALSNTPNP